MHVYGFQITPGSDDALGYCHDSAAAYQKALDHRREIKRVAAPSRLDPTAVYEVALAEVTAETLVAVLNARESASDVLVLSKRLLGLLTED
ncbi:hypothetical protein J2Y48_004815 [Mycoplana sp. BE70]|uniref:hypothetical protein n=1 Tax=Mycoplana sp. BE70 TaxID=2817775 RepID=UPI0028579024|nr:hypothetical protein [Mycoplana sp. BE70]MDR6759499.1 hypothetical protein [Mycoplana sp. BE70]